MRRPLKIYFDGGCRPNPGQMEAAIVTAGQVYLLHDLGRGTSMDAEWLALIAALRLARSFDAGMPDGRDVVLMGDSAAVIAQANGEVRCRGTSLRHFAEFHAVASAAPLPRIRHIKRTQNLAGIALARFHDR